MNKKETQIIKALNELFPSADSVSYFKATLNRMLRKIPKEEIPDDLPGKIESLVNELYKLKA